MTLEKVVYTDGETIIDAAQPNAIQDEIIRVAEKADEAPAKYLPLSGGKLTGDLEGKYITGTRLRATSSGHLGASPEKIPVFDASGWVYWRTPAELKADMHADYTINVKDFGAKGDGSTDDTAAIQAAIDRAVSTLAIAVDNSGNLSTKAFTQ